MPDDDAPAAPRPPGDDEPTRIQPLPRPPISAPPPEDEAVTQIGVSLPTEGDEAATQIGLPPPETQPAPPPDASSEERTVIQRLDAGTAAASSDEATTQTGLSAQDTPPLDDATTDGGYSYTVVDDQAASPAATEKKSSGLGRILILLTGAIVLAAAVGALVWFFAPDDGGGGEERVTRGVSNVINAFSAGQEGTATRFEGAVPPGYPSDIPLYPGARVVASLLQKGESDASYLVIYDTDASRAEVASYYGEQFAADPWQIDAGQDGRDNTLHQFSKIDDPDVTGLVLVAESKEDELTTIVSSVQVIAGAEDLEDEPFTEPAARTVPADFPDDIPLHEGAIPIQSAFQREAGARNFAVTFITRDDPSDVIDGYRDRLEDGDLTVEDGDSSMSTLENAQSLRFSDADLELTGEVAVGTFPEDDSFTQIDLQVSDQRSSDDSD